MTTQQTTTARVPGTAGALAAQAQFEAMFPAGHTPKTDTRTPAQVAATEKRN